MPSRTRTHDHKPLWIAELGPVATCHEHFWQPLRPRPVAVKAVAR